MLGDTEIKRAIASGRLKITRLPEVTGSAGEAIIESSSVDLTIGEIYVPSKMGAQRSVSIPPGGTAVLLTAERLVLPREIGAIVCPKSSVAREAVLLANAGHVDPGYAGHLTLTVVNMGKNPWAINAHRGIEVATLLFFAVADVKEDWADRNEVRPHSGVPVKPLHLEQLDDEFGGIREYVRKEVNSASRKNPFLQGLYFTLIATVVAAAAAGIVAAALLLFPDWGKEDRTERLETEARIERLEDEVSRLTATLESVK